MHCDYIGLKCWILDVIRNYWSYVWKTYDCCSRWRSYYRTHNAREVFLNAHAQSIHTVYIYTLSLRAPIMCIAFVYTVCILDIRHHHHHHHHHHHRHHHHRHHHHRHHHHHHHRWVWSNLRFVTKTASFDASQDRKSLSVHRTRG